MGPLSTGSQHKGKGSSKGSGKSSKMKRTKGYGLPPGKRAKYAGGSNKGKVGPRYPSSLLKELKTLPSSAKSDQDEEEDNEVDLGDVYEYEEGVPEEESGKNRRFDDVDRLEYELPSDFEDEEIPEDTDEEDYSGPQRKAKSSRLDKGEEEEGDGESDEGDGDGDEESDIEEGRHVSTISHNDDSDRGADGSDDEYDADDDERHLKMISDVTGNAAVYLLGQKKRKREPEITEAYEESEYNINPSAVPGSRPITVEDLMSTLKGKPSFGALRKRMEQLEKRSTPLQAPLRKPIQDRVERHAGYEKTKEDITKWQPLVKANRESPCLVFTKKPDIPAPSTASLAAKFEPKTDMEKDIAALLRDNGLAHDSVVQQAETLALNKLSVEEVKERQEKLARMRSLLFQHEVSAKRIKKIKSKTYHRLLQKSQKKKNEFDAAVDPEAARDTALKQEFKRAQERMTLKHKNTSRWAKRILKRGLQAHADDGVRDAIAEQLQAHASLTKKIHSGNMSSSEDESTSEEEDADDASRQAGHGSGGTSRAKLLTKAKIATLNTLEGDGEAEIPTTGLFALPFMARAIEKKRKQAQDNAAALLKQLEAAQDDAAALEDGKLGGENPQSGRLVFGSLRMSPKRYQKGIGDREASMLVNGGSDREGVSESDEDEDKGEEPPRIIAGTRKHEADNLVKEAVVWDPDQVGLVNRDTSHMTKVTGTMSVDFASSKRSPKEAQHGNGHSTRLVNGSKQLEAYSNGTSIQALSTAHSRLFPKSEQDSRNRVKSKDLRNLKGSVENGKMLNAEAPRVSLATSQKQWAGEDRQEKLQPNSDDHVADGPAISGSAQRDCKLAFISEDEEDEDENHNLTTNGPLSQQELIRRAFAGDDVEAEFEKAKSSAIGEELPSTEATVSLPGWGQWTDIQQRKGQPAWILKEQAQLLAKREAAMSNRKDFKLKHVVISERLDKKARKFTTQSLPFPFTSKETFERSMRMPIGRDFNTDKAFRNMIRPKEVKSAGIAIDPIQCPSKTSKR